MCESWRRPQSGLPRSDAHTCTHATGEGYVCTRHRRRFLDSCRHPDTALLGPVAGYQGCTKRSMIDRFLPRCCPNPLLRPCQTPCADTVRQGGGTHGTHSRLKPFPPHPQGWWMEGCGAGASAICSKPPCTATVRMFTTPGSHKYTDWPHMLVHNVPLHDNAGST